MVTGKAIRCIMCVGCENFVWLPVRLSDASCVLGVRILCGYWLSYQVHLCVGCEEFVWLMVKLSDASCVLGVRVCVVAS